MGGWEPVDPAKYGPKKVERGLSGPSRDETTQRARVAKEIRRLAADRSVPILVTKVILFKGTPAENGLPGGKVQDDSNPWSYVKSFFTRAREDEGADLERYPEAALVALETGWAREDGRPVLMAVKSKHLDPTSD